MNLFLFPTSRALRSFKENLLNQNQILPKLLTIDEFEKKSIFVLSKKYISNDARVIFLKEAADFKEFKKLHFDEEFFRFIRNSSYFFRFFEELEKERVNLEDLKSADIYAEFFEHLEILSIFKKRYEEILEKNGCYDEILLPKIYEINENFLKNFSEIVVKLEGFLTNFEIELLEKVSKITTLKIEFKTNRFNKKMQERFKDRFGFEFENGFEYELNLTKQSFKKVKKLNENINGVYMAFSNRLSQVAYVKKKIDDFVKKGAQPKDIAIVLPDESFKEYLNLFDEINNLNFAMGVDFTNSKIFKALALLEEALKLSNIKIELELNRFGIKELLLKWQKGIESFEKFEDLIKDFYKFANEEEIRVIEEELKEFSYLYPYIKDYPSRKILHLFLNRLRDKKLEDSSGGKVTVLGVLESRGVSFDGVVVVDFNEGVVPKLSQKDLFLDSKLRKNANLPTKNDRENLQKYYYYELFRKAKVVAISFVENEVESRSRFLEELNITKKDDYEVEKINSILIKPKKEIQSQKEIVLEYDFTKEEISSTRLRNFLECPRRYYYRYIKKIKEFEIPSIFPKSNEIGVLLHEALKIVYSRKKSYDSVDELKRDFKKIVYGLLDEKDLYIKFELEIWLKKLNRFFENEIERFGKGYKVYEVEKEKYTDFNGFRLKGKIDRIDVYGKSFQIIDYKSSKVKKPTKKEIENPKDFQLIFYYLLLKDLGDIEGLYYYDLNSAKLIREQFLNEKIDSLKEILDSLKKKEIDFKMCEDLSYCKFCPYKIVCDRV